MDRIKSLKYKGRRHLPLPTGKYTVGCCDIMTSYLKFGVFVRLYYPASDQGILERYLQWPQWIPHKEYLNGYAARLGVSPRFYRIMHQILVGKLYIPAIWQASLQRNDEKYPIVIFSHGLSGWRTTYSALCLELASHGFVVAALEHRDHSASASFYKKQARMSASGSNPGSSLCNLDEVLSVPVDFEDVIDSKWNPGPRIQDIGPFCHSKEWMHYQPATKENEVYLRSQQLKHRAKECIEALDLLEDLNLGRFVTNILDETFNVAMFRDQLDLTKPFFIGHSFGGATGILTLATDLRFKTGIFLDPWMLPFYEDHNAFSMISQPFLCLIIKSFQTKKCLKIMEELQSLHSDGEFIVMKRAYHRDVCDAPFVPKFAFSLSSKLGFRIERFSALDLTVDLILQYLGQHLGVCFLESGKDINLLRQKFIAEEDFSSIHHA